MKTGACSWQWTTRGFLSRHDDAINAHGEQECEVNGTSSPLARRKYTNGSESSLSAHHGTTDANLIISCSDMSVDTGDYAEESRTGDITLQRICDYTVPTLAHHSKCLDASRPSHGLRGENLFLSLSLSLSLVQFDHCLLVASFTRHCLF